MHMESILQKQRQYFLTGATLPVAFRAEMLKKLQASIQARESQILQALAADLGKSDFEGYMCEIGMTLSELRYLLRNLRRLAKPKAVPSPISQFPSKSYVQPTPYGNALIMSPWNYPFLLTMEPLVTAIAAGNTAVVKPSAYSPATSAIVRAIVEDCFAPEYVAVVTGGRRENGELLRQKFDFIFFTGSQAVGKEVLRQAAEHLTPVVLELGGKSPCIVDSTAKIPLAARRIVFGKFLNCGQTCVAPDYILCHSSIRKPLVEAICREITAQFGQDPLANPNYGKIISPRHFSRLMTLLEDANCIHGGQIRQDSLQIAPTILDPVTPEDPVMQQEIFGPILPILTWETRQELLTFLAARPKPLALYVFSQDKGFIREVTGRVRYGGGCINDTIIHLASSHLPFGGIGESGMGAYHGKVGFETFSHQKAILDKKNWLDLRLRYQPYDVKIGMKLLRFFMK